MGKKYTTFLTLFTVICITLTGCERENEQTANQGRLNLKLAVDTNVENMVTRATADEETFPTSTTSQLPFFKIIMYNLPGTGMPTLQTERKLQPATIH